MKSKFRVDFGIQGEFGIQPYACTRPFTAVSGIGMFQAVSQHETLIFSTPKLEDLNYAFLVLTCLCFEEATSCKFRLKSNIPCIAFWGGVLSKS